MGTVNNAKESQKDLSMEEVLNSTLVSKAVELFQPETQIRVKPKV